MAIPGRFSAIYYKKDHNCDILFDFLHQHHFWKGVYSEQYFMGSRKGREQIRFF